MADDVAVRSTTCLFGGDIRVTISSLDREYEVEDLKDKTGFLMISIKNRRFTNRLIDRYCRFAVEHLAAGRLTVVDKPYVRNVLATQTTADARSREVGKLERISREVGRRTEKVLARYPGNKLSLVPWSRLVAETPPWLTEEIASGFRKKGGFYDDLIRQTATVIRRPTTDAALEQFAEFLVEEAPVLLYVYYLQGERIVDVYPGENLELIWKIEHGCYAAELPEITRIAASHPGLIYADFQKA